MKRIQDACDAVGCKVEFYGDDYSFTVRFYRHCGEGWGEVVHSAGQNVQADAQLHAQPKSVGVRILEFCVTEKSTKEIQEMLGFKDRRTVRKYINQLIALEQLEMIIPETPNHPGQKYLRKA